MGRTSRTIRSRRATFLAGGMALAGLVFLSPGRAQACPNGPMLRAQDLLWVVPVTLVAVPVGVVGGAAYTAAAGTASAGFGAAALVGTLPMRLEDPERASELTRQAFEAPFTGQMPRFREEREYAPSARR